MEPTLRRAICEKYIAPTQKQRPDCIGVEIEMPVVNLANEPVDEKVALAAAEQFAAHFGFQITGRGADGNFTSAQDSATGDILSFDCCYSNLELSFGKAHGLLEVKERFETYVRFLNSELGKSGYILTGMGIHPNAGINRNQPIPLDNGVWVPFPMTQVIAYRNGQEIFRGDRHKGVFVPPLDYITVNDAMYI